MTKNKTAAPSFYEQVGADRFERRDPWGYAPFASDDAPTCPALPEALLWIASFCLVLMLCSMAMGADMFRIIFTVTR